MNFNQLKASIKTSHIISVIALFDISCNDDKSVNNSTPPTSETGTMVKTDPPGATKKKSWKTSINIAAVDANVKMGKYKIGYYNRREVLPA